MTTEDLDRLQEHYEGLLALEQRATKGPWSLSECETEGVALWYGLRSPRTDVVVQYGAHKLADLRYIAAARNNLSNYVEMVLRMIARVRACPYGDVTTEGGCPHCDWLMEQLAIALAGLERAGRIKA